MEGEKREKEKIKTRQPSFKSPKIKQQDRTQRSDHTMQQWGYHAKPNPQDHGARPARSI
jgi:hypothetical protein